MIDRFNNIFEIWNMANNISGAYYIGLLFEAFNLFSVIIIKKFIYNSDIIFFENWAIFFDGSKPKCL